MTHVDHAGATMSPATMSPRSLLLLLAFAALACGGGAPTCPEGARLDPDSGRCLADADSSTANADSSIDAAADSGADSGADASIDAASDSGASDSGASDSGASDSGASDSGASDSGADACAPSTFYADSDTDGFGDPGATVTACVAPGGYVTDATDCDDGAAAVHPGASEACDGTLDENCDGAVDEGCACTTGMMRACGSATGQCRRGTQTCTAGAWAACAGATGPSAETCDGLDNDCDGATDEELAAPDICLAAGVCAGTVAVCQGARFVCDYGAVANYQAGDESRCDGLDNDCDGAVDETLRVPYYRDADGDGFGRSDMSLQACPGSPPSGYVRNTLDCDDSCGTCFTSAPELCDSLDNDCDGTTDEGATMTYYADADGDGHGAGPARQRCSGGSGWSTVSDDCWDEDGSLRASAALAHPGQTLYFTTGRNDTGSYDWDCDGVAERQWTDGYTGCGMSCSGQGWTSATPNCGASGDFRTCMLAGSCTAPIETRLQRCH